jgi:hypothetical protein
MERFISVLATVSSDKNHIASRYARLLHRLWFQRPYSPTVGAYAPDDTGVDPQAPGMIDPLPINTGVSPTQWGIFNEFGPEGVSFTDTMDGFFVMPPVFPYDVSMFFNAKSDEVNCHI